MTKKEIAEAQKVSDSILQGDPLRSLKAVFPKSKRKSKQA
jgi:hypothetical protein